MSKQHCFTLRVYIEDTDAGGIVYYANYFRFTERARTEWIRALGYDAQYTKLHNMFFVVRSLTSTFHHPARLDDVLTIHTQPKKLAKTYIDLSQNIYRGDNTLLVETWVRIVAVGSKNWQVVRIPKNIHTLVSA